MSLTVLHLLSIGDGGDGLLRVAALRAGEPRDGGVRHLLGAVGEPVRIRLPIAVEPDVRFPEIMGESAGGALRLLREAAARGVGLVHAWGEPAAQLASAALGASARWSAGVRWIGSDLPDDWRPPAGGTPPRLRVECRPGGDSDGRELSADAVVLTPPAPASSAPAAPDRAAARAAMGIPPSVPVVLYVSPLSAAADLMTAAWSCSVASQVHRTLHVLAIGHGPRLTKWEDLLKRGTLWPRCRHLPRAADWPTAVAAADLALDTDLRPTLSAALVSAAGLPLVCSDTPSRRAWTTAAAFCEPGRPRDHARAIHMAVAEPVSRAAATAAVASPDDVWAKLNQIYLRIGERGA